jgi:preprotein translocase subunit SecG
MFKKLLLFFTLAALIGIPTVMVHASDYGLGESAKMGGYKETDNVYTMLGNIIKVTLGILAIVFFGLVLYAGLRWMTARGNEEFTKKAKTILEAAITGLVIVMGAYAITVFLFSRLGITGKADVVATNNANNSPACTNGTKDGFETDVDCGGTCSACAQGKSCVKSTDCSTANCTNGTCAAKACDASDFECGEGCPQKCGIGRECLVAGDCVSGRCHNGICSAP